LSASIFKSPIERCEEIIAAGHEQQAVAGLQIFTEVDPSSCEVWFHIGQTRRCIGDLERAGSALTRTRESLEAESDERRNEDENRFRAGAHLSPD